MRSRGMVFVYVIWNPEDGLYKIGLTWKLKQRITSIQSEVGARLEPVHVIETQNRKHAAIVERCLHRMFGDRREHGEWFRLSTADVDSIVNPSGDLLRIVESARERIVF